MKKPIVIIGSDHGGFEHKNLIKDWLQSEGYQVEDVGPYSLNPDDDYPMFAFGVANRIADYEAQITQPDVIGIIICRSSGGVTIAANKVDGVRAVSVFDEKSAVHAKEHNNANIISLSGDWLGEDEAKRIVEVFLKARFSGAERHKRRLTKIEKFPGT